MTDTGQPPETPFASAARLRALAIDDLATVRFLHTLAIRRLAVSHLSEEEMNAFVSYVGSIEYTDRLAAQTKAGRLVGAILLDEIVATAGWMPANDSGATARLSAVFVSPLFALHGLGRLVVGAVEAQAMQAGYKAFSIRAPIGAVGFFERLGYDVASHGVWTLPGQQPLPVGFLRKVVG